MIYVLLIRFCRYNSDSREKAIEKSVDTPNNRVLFVYNNPHSVMFTLS